MALFKIFKGNANKLGATPSAGEHDTRYAHEGFAYFTPDDGKFYIDIEGNSGDNNTLAVVGTNRIPLNAAHADTVTAANLTTTAGAIAYYSDTSGTFANDSHLTWNDTSHNLSINGTITGASGVAINSSSIPNNTTLYVNGATSINGNLNVGKKLDVGWGDRVNAAQFYTRIFYDVRQDGNNNQDTSYSEGNRLLWTNSGRIFCATSHYANATKVAINSTSEPSYNLYVNGTMGVTGATAFTVTPTAPTAAASTNDTTLATTEFVHNAFTANDAMVFKGIVDATHDLPVEHKQGWTYKVAAAGTYVGQVCEVGDTIYCVEDSSDGASAQVNSDWVVVQNNIDVLPVAKGGTNNTSFTANRMIFSDLDNSNIPLLNAAGHYVDATHLAVNSTSLPTETLYVNGITRGTNNLFIGSSSTANARQIQVETVAGTINLNSGATNSATKGLSVTNASGTAGDILTINQSNQISSIADFHCNPRPDTDGGQTLGDSTHRWDTLFVKKIAFDTGQTTAAAFVDYGDAYTPIYFTGGIPTPVVPVQYAEFTISSGNVGVTLSHSGFTTKSYVLQIVITSGEANINAPIAWTSSAGSIALTTTTAVSGAVSGYILVSRGDSLTVTSTQISS